MLPSDERFNGDDRGVRCHALIAFTILFNLDFNQAVSIMCETQSPSVFVQQTGLAHDSYETRLCLSSKSLLADVAPI